MTCSICGEKDCHGNVPVQLTADQLVDLGLTPDKLIPGGTISMADQNEPKARYPKQEVTEGQKHGYIGDVEVYDPPQSEAGYSNSQAPKSTSQSAKDVQPKEQPVAGATGVIGGSVDNVASKK